MDISVLQTVWSALMFILMFLEIPYKN